MSEPRQEPLVASASQTVGPFFHVGPGASDRCGVVAGPGVPGERIRLRIRVLDGDGAPVDDAMVEIRQADADGAYALPPASLEDPPPAFAGFGRLSTSKDGDCCFETIRPGAPARCGRRCARHRVPVHAWSAAPPLHARLLRRRSGARSRPDPARCVPAERRPTLLAQPRGRRRHLGFRRAAPGRPTRPSSSICEDAVTSRIIDALATTEALSAIFGDALGVQALLDVEAALARAQAALGRDSAPAPVRR